MSLRTVLFSLASRSTQKYQGIKSPAPAPPPAAASSSSSPAKGSPARAMHPSLAQQLQQRGGGDASFMDDSIDSIMGPMSSTHIGDTRYGLPPSPRVKYYCYAEIEGFCIQEAAGPVNDFHNVQYVGPNLNCISDLLRAQKYDIL